MSRWVASGWAFAGGLFLGMGIGKAMGDTGAGTLIGLGAGFLAGAAIQLLAGRRSG